jgi:heat shock protein HslJ
MKFLMKVIIIVYSLILSISCSKHIVDANSNSELGGFELSGLWKFKNYVDGKRPVYEVTLEVKNEEGKYIFNGRSSVNFYFISPEIDRDKKNIRVPAVGSTKIAGTEEANQFEMTYYENFRNVERYELRNKNILIFYLSKPSKEAMYFERK